MNPSLEGPYIDECERLLHRAGAQSVLLVATDLFVEVRAEGSRAPGPAVLAPLLAHPPGDEPLNIELGDGLTLYAQAIDDATATLAVVIDDHSSIGLVRLRARDHIPALEHLLAGLYHPQRGLRRRAAVRRRPPD